MKQTLLAPLALFLVTFGYVVWVRSLQHAATPPIHMYELYQIDTAPLPTVRGRPTIEGVQASSYLVRDVASGSDLARKAPTTQVFPASTIKLATALTALHTYSHNPLLSVPAQAVGQGERVILPVGAQYYANDLIQAAVVQSVNAAALTLAYNHPGGYEGFVRDTNELFESLGLTATHTDTPVGFDTEYTQSTARDLTILSTQAIKQPLIASAGGTRVLDLTSTNTKQVIRLHNTNPLLRSDPRVVGLKTGTTDGARETLITLAIIDGHQVLITLLDSPDRGGDTERILSWLSSSVSWK
ncbi:MAG: D-alanyl-D-alanine carboxypeptidase [Pseudomonadales bacterium]|nr:D-alanyl-D-alanine carboxypeptidase [Pseudomonadales bacterium]